MHIYIVNGYPQSGKTTFEDMVFEEITGWGYTISAVDPAKDIAMCYGWNGEKTPKDRKFLADLLDLLDEWGDIPYKHITTLIKQQLELWRGENGFKEDNCVFFVDCRDPKLIKRLKEYYGAKTILIERDKEKIEYNNHADNNVNDYDYDITIDNSRDLDYLRLAVKIFVRQENLH